MMMKLYIKKIVPPHICESLRTSAIRKKNTWKNKKYTNPSPRHQSGPICSSAAPDQSFAPEKQDLPRNWQRMGPHIRPDPLFTRRKKGHRNRYFQYRSRRLLGLRRQNLHPAGGQRPFITFRWTRRHSTTHKQVNDHQSFYFQCASIFGHRIHRAPWSIAKTPGVLSGLRLLIFRVRTCADW